jgi:hypothetical protein
MTKPRSSALIPLKPKARLAIRPHREAQRAFLFALKSERQNLHYAEATKSVLADSPEQPHVARRAGRGDSHVRIRQRVLAAA